MSNTPTRVLLPLALVVVATLAVSEGPAFANATATARSVQSSIDDIQRRFKERYRELFTLKVAGKVGETSTGMVALVAAAYGDDHSRALIAAENRDRKRYYELLADELKSRAKPEERSRITPALVARRNAARTLADAEPAEYFKMTDGVWIRKRDEAAHKRLLKLKTDGVIGEGANGYLAIRKTGVADARVIEQENKRRSVFYDRIAKLRRAPAETIAAEYARDNQKSARNGDWIRSAQGEWARAKRR